MAENFEPRRLIKFGNSSFIVSLPKAWIEKNSLKKGDWIYLKEGEENGMTIFPKEKKYLAVEKKIEIDMLNKSLDDLKREITSAYINNFSMITVTGKEMRKNVPDINNIIKTLTGMEIIEQTQKEIILKDFLSIETISLRKIIRRLDNSLRGVFEDLNKGMEDKQFKKSLFEEILEEDNSINKLYFLVLKITKAGMNNKDLMKFFEMDYDSLSFAQWLAVNLEYLGDDLKRVARYLSQAKMNDKQKEGLKRCIGLIERDFIEVMTAYHKSDLGLARGVLREKPNVLNEIDKLCGTGKDVLTGNICERLKMVYSHIYNIAKLMIY